MHKKGILVLHVGLLFSLNAMNMEIVHDAHQKEKNLICYLARMPNDVLQYLTQFLEFNNIIESDEEFTERTKPEKQEEVPEELYKDIFKPEPFELGQGCFGISAVFSPNKSKIGIIEQLYGNSKPIVTIIDRPTNVIQSKTTLSYFEDIKGMALSSCGNLLALTHYKMIPNTGYTEEINYQYVMSILNLKKQQGQDNQESSDIAMSFFVDSIGFNKQGTKIITHGGDHDNKIHRMYPIVSDEECQQKEKKVFDMFLAQKGVCKNFLTYMKSIGKHS